jgi:hypothetical protein
MTGNSDTGRTGSEEERVTTTRLPCPSTRCVRVVLVYQVVQALSYEVSPCQAGRGVCDVSLVARV